MKVVVATGGDTFTLEVSEDLELENFKAFVGYESGLEPHEIAIFYNNVPLTDNQKSLGQHGIHDGDIVRLERSRKFDLISKTDL